MPSVITLDGPRRGKKRRGAGLGDDGAAVDADGCRCIYNSRTKRWGRLCPDKRVKTGWAFQKGGAAKCAR